MVKCLDDLEQCIISFRDVIARFLDVQSDEFLKDKA